MQDIIQTTCEPRDCRARGVSVAWAISPNYGLHHYIIHWALNTPVARDAVGTRQTISLGMNGIQWVGWLIFRSVLLVWISILLREMCNWQHATIACIEIIYIVQIAAQLYHTRTWWQSSYYYQLWRCSLVLFAVMPSFPTSLNTPSLHDSI